MSPAEVLAKHTSRELTEWMAFLTLEPVGEERADLRSGIVASTIANVNRKKGTRAYKPEEFMPKFGEDHELTEDEMEMKIQRFSRAFGGKSGKLSEEGG